MLPRVVDKLVMLRRIARTARTRQVPARKHARARVHVGFGVVTDAHREQLHDLARKIFLRLRFRVRPAIQPDEHGGIFRDVEEDVAEVAERVRAQHLDLAGHASGIVGGFRRHVASRFGSAERAGDLVVAGREEVVPEERHLLLKRPVGVHHPEQPPLTCVGDIRVRRKLAARGDSDISGPADPVVDLVGNAIVVYEDVDGVRRGQSSVEVELVGPRAKPGAPEQMFDLRVDASCHPDALLGARTLGPFSHSRHVNILDRSPTRKV